MSPSHVLYDPSCLLPLERGEKVVVGWLALVSPIWGGLNTIAFCYDMLHHLPRGKSRCPRPLEIVAAQVSGDIDDLTDDKQPRGAFRFHGF